MVTISRMSFENCFIDIQLLNGASPMSFNRSDTVCKQKNYLKPGANKMRQHFSPGRPVVGNIFAPYIQLVPDALIP